MNQLPIPMAVITVVMPQSAPLTVEVYPVQAFGLSDKEKSK